MFKFVCQLQVSANMDVTKLVILLLVLDTWSESFIVESLSLRIKPNQELEDFNCQYKEHEPCETLSYYTAHLQNNILNDTRTINLTFLPGRHYPVNYTTETMPIQDKELLVIQGIEDTELVNYKFQLLSIDEILIINVYTNDLSINLHKPAGGQQFTPSEVTIRNCTFTESQLSFKAALVHIKYSRFIGNSQNTALKLYSSYVTFYGEVLFLNNNAVLGGALSLIESIVHLKGSCSVDFINNSAEEKGGAIFIDNNNDCFFVASQAAAGSGYLTQSCRMKFCNNSARSGGDHIYGTSFMSECQSHMLAELDAAHRNNNWKNLFAFEHPSFNNGGSMSAVSSMPSRVCLCDDHGQPACADINKIFIEIESCPGEVLSIPVVIVGGDFGATLGSIHAGFLHENCSQTAQTQLIEYPIKQNRNCTILKYKTAIISRDFRHTLLYLTATLPLQTDTIQMYGDRVDIYKREIEKQTIYYETHGIVKDLLRFTPVFLNISVLDCPSGFTIYKQNGVKGCECYMPLQRSIDVTCTIEDHKGYISWNTTAWIGFNDKNDLIFSKHCFPYYCRREYKKIDVGNETMLNTQCRSNRQGILCSKCRDGYSLAIGSSNCIPCDTNNNLALFIFFAFAGLLLVLFINVFNITVSQGMINGLIFYANIVWEHQSIASQEEIKFTSVFLKTFIAWLNLDFGIETCFIRGLDAYTKTWLQFLFPLHIWAIAVLMILAAHYSTRVTNLIGNRALHTLCTLFFLSYSKLFRIIKDVVHLTVLTTVDNNGSVYTDKIWLWDGDHSLEGSKFLVLFVFAAVLFLLLWVPYTIVLMCIQPLRKHSHYKCCKWITKMSPIFDSYLAPLKHNHQYLFGVLLLTKGFLLMIILVPSRGLNLHNLMIIAVLTLILIHMAVSQPYRSKAVLLFQCVSFGNLVILVGVISFMKIEDQKYKYWVVATSVSVTVAFVQFCIIVVLSVVKVCHNNFNRVCRVRKTHTEDRFEDEQVYESSADVIFNTQTVYLRDSILEY